MTLVEADETVLNDKGGGDKGETDRELSKGVG